MPSYCIYFLSIVGNALRVLLKVVKSLICPVIVMFTSYGVCHVVCQKHII